MTQAMADRLLLTRKKLDTWPQELRHLPMEEPIGATLSETNWQRLGSPPRDCPGWVWC